MFKTDKLSIFDELQDDTGGIFIAGPSGTAKEYLELATLFDEFQPGSIGFQWLLLVLVYLTGGRHHSVDEVTLAAEVYDSKYDMEHLSADQVMIELLKPFGSVYTQQNNNKQNKLVYAPKYLLTNSHTNSKNSFCNTIPIILIILIILCLLLLLGFCLYVCKPSPIR